MMRTTLDIDEKLIETVVALTGEKSRGKAVSKALEEYIRKKRVDEFRAMAGTIDLADNWYEMRHMDPR